MYINNVSTPTHSACSESVGGPSGAARGRQPQFWRAHGDGRKSLRRRRRSAGGDPLCRRRRHGHKRSAFRTVSRILVTTSGELILLPVGAGTPY